MGAESSTQVRDCLARMRATPRSRLFNNRVTAAGDEEAQQQASARRRVTGRHSSFYDRNRRLSSRRRRRRRGGVQSLFQCPRGRVTVVIAIATWTVTFPLIRLASTPLPAVTESFGPDSIPSVFRVERRKRHGGPREQRGLGTGSANEGSLRSICLNTAQGVTLLADSEGRVCYRNNTDQDPLRSGCCSTTQPLPHPPLPSDRALSVLADSGDKRKLNLRRTVTSDNYAAASGEVAARRHGDDEVEVVNARAGRLSNGDAFGDDFPPSEALLAPFSCWRCHVSDMDGGSSCCRSYEFCVSCCLDPQRAHEREAIHAAAARSGHPAYGYSGYTNNDLQVSFCLCLY